jgi:cytochrome c oxidase assembly protein subunit 15
MSRFTRYAWFVVGYNVLVIIGGALVRATGSGAGCGRHWPTCNGEVIPRAENVSTIIEFSHRMTSTMAGFLVIGLLIWAYRVFVRGSLVRRAALLSFIFIVIEGALGAGLVLLELVEDNASVWRAIAVALHLVNTFVLLMWLVLTAWSSHAQKFKKSRIEMQASPTSNLLIVGMVGLALLSAAGAITALGDTLFLSGSLARTVGEENAAQHFLVQLRVIHPVLAVIVSALLAYLCINLMNRSLSPVISRLGGIALGLIGLQMLVGLLTIVLRAPLFLQMSHLLLADTMWIIMLLLTFEVLAERAVQTQRIFANAESIDAAPTQTA